ncbi:MAG TPA: lysophospholipid acyltransferase family protein [Phycisphaerae bacterium]|nr:1-acyl-sn-glycerol-3-phosphate acyltransferase [Phycisphaerae bacterium]HOB75380.1 lysophospholipid acyltransferase family protein [Phycisphaerae bacterium]HOJ55948.1 lysophospholipid acyltransferase family protein [Phycisphaerae bacterium]HOL26702.1 lysophospholipid acyltransferase family protein [Phycisphaerae bacterium]HPP20549.1 lysophospholipid acyltransferase family protein [Phycisphaerae bacterium]
MNESLPPITASRAIDHRPAEGMRLYYRFCRFICQWVMTLLLRARVFGLHNVPPKGGALLVCNHQSFLDPVLVTMALHREGNYMARDSLFRSRLFRVLIESLNAFPVRRNTADLGAIKEAMRRIKQGRVVVVYPEGTRTEDGRIGPMFPGLAAIAKKTGVPIVPTLIDGVFQAWPRNRKWPSLGDVIVEYGRPILPAEYEHLSAEELIELIRDRLIAMQQRWHSRVPRRRLKLNHENPSARNNGKTALPGS